MNLFYFLNSRLLTLVLTFFPLSHLSSTFAFGLSPESLKNGYQASYPYRRPFNDPKIERESLHKYARTTRITQVSRKWPISWGLMQKNIRIGS
jgi:hypothetical protein